MTVNLVRSLKELKAERPAGSVVTVGTFDGVHLGHAAVVAEVTKWAKDLGCTPAVLAFTRPPRSVLGKLEGADLVTSPEHRALLLERLGVELLLELDFSAELAALSAREFAAEYLVAGFAAGGLVLGHDARLGRGGAAGFDELREIGAESDFDVRHVGPVMACEKTVSYTHLRAHET